MAVETKRRRRRVNSWLAAQDGSLWPTVDGQPRHRAIAPKRWELLRQEK